MDWQALSRDLHRRTHGVFAEPVRLDGNDIRAVVDYDAEVMMGEVYDRRTLIEFLAEDLDAMQIEPGKGMSVEIGEREYRLDQRVPQSNFAIGQSSASTPHTQKWMLR